VARLGTGHAALGSTLARYSKICNHVTYIANIAIYCKVIDCLYCYQHSDLHIVAIAIYWCVTIYYNILRIVPTSGCLHSSRHAAIASPSLKTFDPLTLLRRSLADIEDAIRDAKKFFTFENGHIDFEKLFVNNDAKAAKPERTEVQYDYLLEKIKALNSVLNNEIQLVIGSVTVKVSHT
jgi:hypothetical protein